MTINDMIEQGTEIQGNTEIRRWNNEKENYDIKTDVPLFELKESNEWLFNLEITHMYAIDNILVIEVKEQE